MRDLRIGIPQTQRLLHIPVDGIAVVLLLRKTVIDHRDRIHILRSEAHPLCTGILAPVHWRALVLIFSII